MPIYNDVAFSMIILKVLGILLVSVLLLVLVYLILLPLGSLIPVNLKYRPTKNGIPIYLSTNGMHTDFILPSQNHLFDWTKIIDNQPFAKKISEYPYLGLGWGDWNFYIELEAWESLPPKLAAKALLNPTTPTLMHVTGYEQLPHDTLRVEKIDLSNTQYLQLCDFIYTAFALNNQQKINLLPGLGYTEHDNFYKAHGSYHALHTCNYWVNKGLKKIGVRTALWSPLDRGIFHQLEKVKPSSFSNSVTAP